MEQTCEQSPAAAPAVDEIKKNEDDTEQRCERLRKSIAELQEQRHKMGIDSYDDFMRYQESEHRHQMEKQHKRDVKQLMKFQEQMDQHLGGHFEFVDKPTKHFKFEFIPNGDGTVNFEATQVIQKVLKFIKKKKEPKRLRKPKKTKKEPEKEEPEYKEVIYAAIHPDCAGEEDHQNQQMLEICPKCRRYNEEMFL